MARVYAQDEERRIRLQEHVREWTRSGLLDPGRAAALQQELRVDLKRTGLMLRLGLAIFTAVVSAATVGLTLVGVNLDSGAVVATVLAVSAAVFYGVADFLARQIRLYRYGVEEVLVMSAVALVSVSAVLLLESIAGPLRDRTWLFVGLTVGAVASLEAYRRFGFRYAGIAAVGCAALVPLQLGLSFPADRLAGAVALIALLAFLAARPSDGTNEGRAADRVVFTAATTVALYLMINLVATHGTLGTGDVDRAGTFRWLSWLATWAIPIATGTAGLRRRERVLIDVSLALLLTTMVTNKPYLGLAPRPWDPILFGAVLIVAAVAVRRWLNGGEGGARRGFTAGRILASERDLVRWVGVASAAVRPAHDAPADTRDPTFGGGRSGGGGAGGEF
jgi:hypothetical protein